MKGKQHLVSQFLTLLLMMAMAVLISSNTGQKQHTTSNLPDADTRLDLTLKGIFNYYWKEDPYHKKIEFLFACGQLGMAGTGTQGQCSCYVTNACVNCYRWWTAIMVESVATYSIHTNSSNFTSLPSTVYSHSPYNANYNPASAVTCTYIDDFLWYGIAYLRVYDWLSVSFYKNSVAIGLVLRPSSHPPLTFMPPTLGEEEVSSDKHKDEKWLNNSLALYDWAWKYGWDDHCGGFYWNTCPSGKYKFNIQLLEAMHFASKLAHTIPNNTRYLADAERLWNWFFSYDNGYGLMTDQYLVSTAAIPFDCCNATSTSNACYNSKSHDSAYSQGLLLSSSAYLYLSTGKRSYIDVGIRAFEAIAENYTTRDGVLKDEMRGFRSPATSTCSVYADPGGDWFSFNGIFMLHLAYFTELLVKNGSMPLDTLKRINNLVQNTSDSAWSKSAVWPPFNKTDVCSPGSAPVNKNESYPKFHWWWIEKTDFDFVTPTDPAKYYTKTQLRCHTLNGNDTQIWEGQVATEAACMNKCDHNINCSKYLWQTYEGEVENYNCWIWDYNRTNHICNQTDSSWNIGIKRPQGNASCAGKCGSNEPQKLEHGVCYCDSNCSKYLDCCKDYAKECRAEQPPTCKGHCNQVIPQPVFEGGYCWCTAGCTTAFIGGSSCCADYQHFCDGGTVHPCMDGRTQGSALNLFLSHSIVSKVSYN